MPKSGRPPILADPFMQASVLRMIAAGASRAAAARFVGVDVKTLRRRIRTDKAFAQRFLEAKAHHHGYAPGRPKPRPAARRPAPAQASGLLAPDATPQPPAIPARHDSFERDLFKHRLVQLLHRAIDAFHRDQRRIPLEVMQSLTSPTPDLLAPFPYTPPRIPHPPHRNR